jgi:hypothetical protein
VLHWLKVLVDPEGQWDWKSNHLNEKRNRISSEVLHLLMTSRDHGEATEECDSNSLNSKSHIVINHFSSWLDLRRKGVHQVVDAFRESVLLYEEEYNVNGWYPELTGYKQHFVVVVFIRQERPVNGEVIGSWALITFA